MFLRELKQPVTLLADAGPVTAKNLARLGIYDIGALLCHFPRDWEDRSRQVPIKDWNTGHVCTEITVLAHDWFGFGRTKTLKIYIEDSGSRASLLCFNNPYIAKKLQPGTRWKLFGKFIYKQKYRELQSSNFEVEPLYGSGSRADAGRGSFGRILPVYPLTEGLLQNQLRKLMCQALDKHAAQLEDELPESVIARDGLLRKADALKAIHFPATYDELEKAKKTLIYEELFYLEVMVGKRAMQRKTAPMNERGPPSNSPSLRLRASVRGICDDFSPFQRRLVERLPFDLTPGQKEAAAEINRDMDGPFPMARLLQGDVGSGKTLVSFLAALRAVEGGGQAALLAPTELLARQHAENAARLLEPLGVRIAFLTGNLKAAGRAQLLKALAAGEIDFVAGTHALFSRDVIYRSLRLVIVDEQHRFGVTQRQAIMAKGFSPADDGSPSQSRGRLPDLLMMSATPIPRSLALTVFGDLDVSVIRDMPPGRKPVTTHLAMESREGNVYDFVRRKLALGQQAYFVYPLIEGGDENDLKDAVFMADRLAKEVYPDYSVALLHSRIDEEEKRRIMDAFRSGDIKILVATSVVEVGVDVPNAACMVIEHAERFGLSALHQLRGRVGRGSDQAYCFLVYSDKLTDDGKARLKLMLRTSDGFEIAEEDLKLRGPGQIAGIEQSGYLKLGIADPVRDAEELARARKDAFAILESDPALEREENRRIAEVLERAPPFGDVVF